MPCYSGRIVSSCVDWTAVEIDIIPCLLPPAVGAYEPTSCPPEQLPMVDVRCSRTFPIQLRLELSTDSFAWHLTAGRPLMRGSLSDIWLVVRIKAPHHHKMSLDFGVGDFIELVTLANDIRRRFIGAPEGFKAISSEWVNRLLYITQTKTSRIKLLGIALQDLEDLELEQGLNSQQKVKVLNVSHGCLDVLGELRGKLDGFQVLDSGATNIKGKARRVWKRLVWDQDEISSFRQRIISSLASLNLLIEKINR